VRNAVTPLARAGTGAPSADALGEIRQDPGPDPSAPAGARPDDIDGEDEDALSPLTASHPAASSLGRRRDNGPAAPSPRPRASLPGLPGRTGAPAPSPGAEGPGRVPPALTRPPAAMHLSPRMTAVFGGLFGLATVTSIVALLIQVVPPRDERAVVAAHLSGLSLAPPKTVAPTINKKQRTPVPGPWRIAELAKDPSALVVSEPMDRRSFVTALSDKDVPKAQVYRILKAFEGLRKFDKSGRKDRFTVAMDKATRRVRAFEYEVSASEVYQAREDANGLLTGVQLDMKIAEEEVVSAFYVGKDVSASYRAGGLEDGILDVIDDALSGRLSTETFEEGSTVRLIATEETSLGLFSRYKKVIALEYRPADPTAKPVRIYHFTGQEGRGYFDERGRQPYAGGWRSPVPGAPITSRFNPKRMHPVLKKVMPHNGTDFGAPTGTPIYASYRGTVGFIGNGGPAGNLVMLKHANGIETGYAHMSRFVPGMKVGDKVGTAQLIGYVGSTGRSTGPHLHFIAKKDGKFIDAETLQLDGERIMPSVDRAAFQAAKEALDKRLDAIPLPEPPPEPPPPAAAAPGSAAAPGEPAPSPSGAPGAPGAPGAAADASAAAAVPAAAPAAGTGDPAAAEPAGDPAAVDPAEMGDEDGEDLKGVDLKKTPE